MKKILILILLFTLSCTEEKNDLLNLKDLISLSIPKINDSNFKIDKDNNTANLTINYTKDKKDLLEGSVAIKFEISKAASLEVDGKIIKSGQSITFKKEDKDDKYTFSKDIFVIAENKERNKYQVIVILKKIIKINMSFDTDLLNVKIGEANPIEPKLIGHNTEKGAGEITYSSSDDKVATVNPKTGELKILALGKTTIKAVQEETETHTKGEASYQLNVSDKKLINLKFSLKTLSVYLSATKPIAPKLSGHNTASDAGAIKYSSSNTAVATVNAKTGELKILALGKTTIKAIQEETETHTKGEASYTLIVKDKKVINMKFTPDKLVLSLLNKDPIEPKLSGHNTEKGAGAITYSSSDDKVATVDSKTGELKLIAVGTCNITAIQAETSTHKSSIATYSLTIENDKITPKLSFDFPAGKSYFVFIGHNDVPLPKLKGAYVGNKAGTISYSSSKTDRLEIDNNGKMKPKEFGILYVTVSQAEGDYNKSAQAKIKVFVFPIIAFISRNLTINKIEKTSISIDWRKYNFKGTYFKASYKIDIRDINGNPIAGNPIVVDQPTDPKVTKLTRTITGLKPNTIYKIKFYNVYGTLLSKAIEFRINTKGDDDMFIYDAANGIISGYTAKYLNDKTQKVLTIPSSIGSTTIRKIGKSAFTKNKTITELIMPNTITHVQMNAFYECDNLAKITFSNSLEEIEYGAFLGTSITKLDNLPNTLTTMGVSAFQICKKLTDVVMPNSVKNIGARLFSGCSSLKNVTLPNQIDRLADLMFKGTAIESFVIPSNIKDIGWAAFWASKLKTVTIPEGVEKISINAFEETPLEKVTIPSSVDTIESDAFDSCKELVEVNLSEGLKFIGNSAFRRCYKLKKVVLPKSLEKIDRYAFSQKGITTPIMVVKMPNKPTPPTIIEDLSTDPDSEPHFYKVKEIQIPKAYEAQYRRELNGKKRKYDPSYTTITTY